MLEYSERTHQLMQAKYQYELQDVPDPNLYREIFDYESIPKIAFNNRLVPINMPAEIWMTDTTFRDGQQSVQPLQARADRAPLQAGEPPGRPQGADPAERVLPLHRPRPRGAGALPGAGAEIPGDHHLDSRQRKGLPARQGRGRARDGHPRLL